MKICSPLNPLDSTIANRPQLDAMPPDDQEAYTDLISDFYEYSKRLGSYLDEQGIKHILTGSRFIEIKVGKRIYCYDKTKLKEDVGVILSDRERRPKAVPGLFTDLEIIPIIAGYYSLKSATPDRLLVPYIPYTRASRCPDKN